MTEHEAYIAFNMVPNIGAVKVAALAEKHGSVAAAWEAFGKKTDWEGKPVDWRAEMARARKMHVTLVTCDDPRYPASLNDLPSKPLVLYVVGDPAALAKPGVAVVGTRLPTLYGTDMAEKFAIGLVKGGLSVISGLATGIDAAAHKGALAAGGVTVGVLGGALDRFFPEENRELGRQIVTNGGAVVSEYPFGFPPGKQTFPQRNRIVAALARGVLAVEAPVGSGTLITCTFGEQLGRKVMAIPANLDSRHSAGCWKLIREGAMMATSVKEVLAAVTREEGRGKREEGMEKREEGMEKREEGKGKRKEGTERKGAGEDRKVKSGEKDKGAAFTLEEQAVLKQIPSTGITLDRLAFKTKLPAKVVGDVTMSLRMKRLIRFLPGNRVAPAADSANL